jgi:type III secretory pathway component EscS
LVIAATVGGALVGLVTEATMLGMPSFSARVAAMRVHGQLTTASTPWQAAQLSSRRRSEYSPRKLSKNR